MILNRQSKAVPSSEKGLWWLIAFDLLLGGLFLSGSVTGFGSLRTPAPDGTAGGRLVSLFASSFDFCLAAILILSGVLLLRRSRKVGVSQRAIFWALLLRCVFVMMEASLPGLDGLGGLSMMGSFLVLVLLTGVALAGGVAVSRRGAQQ